MTNQRHKERKEKEEKRTIRKMNLAPGFANMVCEGRACCKHKHTEISQKAHKSQPTERVHFMSSSMFNCT